MTVHLPKNLPDPSDQPDSFERGAIRAIAHYLEQTQGKAFVLFTSYKMLEAAARALTPWLARRNIALFAQSDGMPRSKMVDAFKADINSVIFGADSFWQGVDVPGEALSNVIITRLPFSVPSHPLLEARLEDIRSRGGSPFVEYQVPEAVIKLKQGFGRLIRTKTDRGIVVILDPRVLTKPYGRTFLELAAPMPADRGNPSFRRCLALESDQSAGSMPVVTCRQESGSMHASMTYSCGPSGSRGLERKSSFVVTADVSGRPLSACVRATIGSPINKSAQ